MQQVRASVASRCLGAAHTTWRSESRCHSGQRFLSSIYCQRFSPGCYAQKAGSLALRTGREFIFYGELKKKIFTAACPLATRSLLSLQCLWGPPAQSHPFILIKGFNSVFFQQVSYRSTQSLDVKGQTSSSTGQREPNVVVNFDDHRLAFSNKTTLEIVRALGVLWFCSFEWLADNSLKLMKMVEKVLGRRLGDWLLKKTVYGQFVAGDNSRDVMAAVSKLRAVHVGPLLAAPMEDDVHVGYETAENLFDENLSTILKSMAMSRDMDPTYPMIQMRITALMPGNLCAFLSEKCPEPSNRPSLVESLAAVLSGKKLEVTKIFGEKFPEAMECQLEKGLQRIARVCEAAVADRVMVMVDAEYTYLNPALNLATLAMMLRCNAGNRLPLVFYTYQNYLKGTREVLLRDLQFVESRDVGFGAKVVRGAYMYKERRLAAEEGRRDPVYDTYHATSAAYNQAVALLLGKVAQRPNKYRLIVASHNEESVLLAIKRMQELGISPNAGSVFFGQLYGMADHMSTNLGVAGFLARKSIAYGPVQVTLPYLCRRFQENKAVFAGARRERTLLTAALKDRLLGRK